MYMYKRETEKLIWTILQNDKFRVTSSGHSDSYDLDQTLGCVEMWHTHSLETSAQLDSD